MNEVFSKRLNELRTEKGLSFAELSKELGTSSVSLGYYERGERVPDIDMLKKICSYFGITSDYLIGLSDNRTVENADIGERTGLNDEAINILDCMKSLYNGYSETLNFLIEQDEFEPIEENYYHHHDEYSEVCGTKDEIALYKEDYRKFEEKGLIPILSRIDDFFRIKMSEDAIIRIYPTSATIEDNNNIEWKAFSHNYPVEKIIEELIANEIKEDLLKARKAFLQKMRGEANANNNKEE